MSNILTSEFLRELESEAPATRKCLEKISIDLLDWKPHEKSMKMSGLVVMSADMPNWIAAMITDGVIDLSTYPQFKPQSTQDLVEHLDKSMDHARTTLKGLADEDLNKEFKLLMNGQVVWATPLGQGISNTINHWVHHRGQLSVYMRLNNLAVPSLYGPSADEQSF